MHHVSVFSHKLRSFGTRGSGPGQIVHPCEVAVVDSNNQCILKANIPLRTTSTQGSGHLQFSGPTGIAFNASNNKIYIGDTNNHRVQVLNSDLTFSSTFGKEGDRRMWPNRTTIVFKSSQLK
jgi:tripartite motif-containing protein 2/3/tripartite motif-containing protein 71